MNFINKYNEFNNILSGCRTILDAYHFHELYCKHNPEMKEITQSMINGKFYDKSIDFKSMKLIINSIESCKYKNDAEDIVKIYSARTNNIAQLNTFKRLLKNKLKLPEKVVQLKAETQEKNEIIKMIKKKCPHCGNECECAENTTYTICGYYDTRIGYDLSGCGRDWCFKCEKKLCKIWEKNQLYLLMNRLHDNTCCLNHSKNENMKYPDDYCQCDNVNVCRRFNIDI